MPTLATNKRAKYDYEISDIYEAGIVLFGQEVKSVKTGHISLKGSFVTIKRGQNSLPEIYLTNAHIPLYSHAKHETNYNPDRPRKLLLHKNQISRLIGKKQEQGLTLIPLKIYTKFNLIKVSFGIGRGKKKHDKRAAIKKRDTDKKIRTLIKKKLR